MRQAYAFHWLITKISRFAIQNLRNWFAPHGLKPKQLSLSSRWGQQTRSPKRRLPRWSNHPPINPLNNIIESLRLENEQMNVSSLSFCNFYNFLMWSDTLRFCWVNRSSSGKASDNYSQMLSLAMHSCKHVFAQIAVLYFLKLISAIFILLVELKYEHSF